MNSALFFVVCCAFLATIATAFNGMAFGGRIVRNSNLKMADVDITWPNGKKSKAASGSSMKDGRLFII
jgi:hypothetical protein